MIGVTGIMPDPVPSAVRCCMELRNCLCQRRYPLLREERDLPDLRHRPISVNLTGQ